MNISPVEQGVLIITVDTPFVPEDVVDANFATDDALAGRLIGQYAKVMSAYGVRNCWGE